MVKIRRSNSGLENRIRLRRKGFFTCSSRRFVLVLGGSAVVWWAVLERSTFPYMLRGKPAAAIEEVEQFGLESPFEAGDFSLSSSGRTRVQCKYHGNCPVGTTCIAHTCLPYMGINLENKQATSITQLHTILELQQKHQECVESCKEELEWDEAFQFSSTPDITKTMTARNGHGCVLNYQRQVNKPKPSISFQEWLELRQHRLIRVDPAPDGTWNALCDLPCEYASSCGPEQDCAVLKMSGGHTPDLDGAIKSCLPLHQMHHYNDMIIVTGANAQYFRGLKNLASSAKYWAPHYQLVIYNLGLTEDQLYEVQSWKNVHKVHWLDGIPNDLPIHVRNLHNYAWKSIIINETVHQYKSIFWLDAGATFTGPLDGIQTMLQRHGMFLVHGQDEDMKGLAHSQTYEWFGESKDDFQGGPHFAGGIQGHVYPSRYIDTVVIPNAKCALNKSCIAPPGSNLRNHRFDQTSLSILAYQSYIQAPGYTEYLAASRGQLVADLRQPSRMVIWTSRNSCEYYTKLNLLGS